MTKLSIVFAVLLCIGGCTAGTDELAPTRQELLAELSYLPGADVSPELTHSWVDDYLASDESSDDHGVTHFEVPGGQPTSDPGTGTRTTNTGGKCSKPRSPKPGEPQNSPEDTDGDETSSPTSPWGMGSANFSSDRTTARVSCCNYKTCYSFCRRALTGYRLSSCLSQCDRDFNHCAPID